MLDYEKFLNQNMQNVLKDILKQIEQNGISGNNHLYITFLTTHKNVKIPKWLKEKYPEDMTIVIQYEYYNLKIEKEYFFITLSFNDIKVNLKIDYNAVLSFADPSANFGLKLKTIKPNVNINKIIKKKNNKEKSNVINFSSFKKN